LNKPFYIIIFLLLFCCEAKTQTNLVPNPGFEFYTQCPFDQVQTSFAYPWYDPTNFTSDYFNACAIGTDVGIPNNGFGYQVPHQGNGYCGFGALGTCPDWCAEYIAVPLLQPLQAGKRYCVSFWLSLADTVCVANNMIGAYFDNDSITNFGALILNVVPQIKFTQIITDKINWVKMQSSFTAAGGEKYMAISTFDTTGVDTTILCDNFISYSYYYIDDVSVIESDVNCQVIIDTAVFTTPTLPNIFTPNSDGINDVWTVNCTETSSLTIINRWGNKVKEMNNKVLNWDGHTTSGELCGDGIYYYIIQNTQTTQKGFIQLLR